MLKRTISIKKVEGGGGSLKEVDLFGERGLTNPLRILSFSDLEKCTVLKVSQLAFNVEMIAQISLCQRRNENSNILLN